MQESEANARGEDKKRRRVIVDEIRLSAYLTDSHVCWVDNLNSTATKEQLQPLLFSSFLSRVFLARSLPRIYYPRPRDYFEAPARLSRSWLLNTETMHHSKIVIVSPKQTICIPL